MWTVTLTIVPPAKTVPPNNATAVICSVCPMAARRQMATMARSAVMAGVTRPTWARRDVISLGVPFRGVASGFISRDFTRVDVILNAVPGSPRPCPLPSKARARPWDSPSRAGTTTVTREVRALTLASTSREKIHDAELHEQLTVDPSLRILHPPAAVKPIRHPQES